LSVRIEILSWEKAEPAAAPIRFASFFEKDARPGVEVDELDAQCVHALAYDEHGKAVGTARLLPDGQIGQIAVVKDWRRRGVGAALLEALIGEARKRSYAEVTLTAPLQAAEFYRVHGFAAEGKITPVGGILVQKMRKTLIAV
jgi:predicted GNAT family N-acyltransferase